MSPKKLTLFIIAFCFISIKNYAFKGPPPPGLPNPPAAPINNEIFVLIAAGLLLGCFSIYKRKKTTD